MLIGDSKNLLINLLSKQLLVAFIVNNLLINCCMAGIFYPGNADFITTLKVVLNKREEAIGYEATIALFSLWSLTSGPSACIKFPAILKAL